MDLYIKGVPASGTSRSTAKLMKTGQTTSYRTGDDGDLEAGRNVDFSTLAENNPFGNTNRFTDELGGQTYTKNIVIDWSTYDGSTVLGYRRTLTAGNWNTLIDAALIVSIAPFTSGWRSPNLREVFNIMNYSLIQPASYSPFNIASNLHTSTTDPQSTNSLFGVSSNGLVNSYTKISSLSLMPVRTFTVTGTTLS